MIKKRNITSWGIWARKKRDGSGFVSLCFKGIILNGPFPISKNWLSQGETVSLQLERYCKISKHHNKQKYKIYNTVIQNEQQVFCLSIWLSSTHSLLYSPLPSYKVKVLVAQLCPTLCNPMDYSPSGSSVHGILQARILQWVAILFCRGSS